MASTVATRPPERHEGEQNISERRGKIFPKEEVEMACPLVKWSLLSYLTYFPGF
jgi:hypothetical protein